MATTSSEVHPNFPFQFRSSSACAYRCSSDCWHSRLVSNHVTAIIGLGGQVYSQANEFPNYGRRKRIFEGRRDYFSLRFVLKNFEDIPIAVNSLGFSSVYGNLPLDCCTWWFRRGYELDAFPRAECNTLRLQICN